MKRIVFTAMIMSIGICLMAQTKGKRKISTGTPKTTLPIKGGAIKGSQLDKPYLADTALSKCERYMRYYKRLLKTVLIADPDRDNPLEITKETRKARILYSQGRGHIVIDKTAGSVPFPPLYQIANQPINGVFPVEVSAFGFLDDQSGQVSTVGIAWEAGVYDDVISVEDVYRTGNQAYADIKRANGTINSIMIFPQHLMDGCQLDQR